MKTFKLIKEYPGSPTTIGIEIFKNGAYWQSKFATESVEHFHVHYSNLNPEEFFEYWEEIINKDYEILSFQLITSSSNDGIRYKNNYGMFPSTNGKDITSRNNEFSEERLLKDFYYTIHSIKRLSDGEIFTIGDVLTPDSISHDKDGEDIKITKIGIVKDVFSEVASAVKEKVEGKLMISAGNRYNNYNTLLKTARKQSLFTTEDGIDIFEGDSYYYFRFHSWTFCEAIANYEFYSQDRLSTNSLYFSTREKAEEYTLMNKPCLSIKDLTSFFSYVGSGTIIKLQEIVKSKS